MKCHGVRFDAEGAAIVALINVVIIDLCMLSEEYFRILRRFRIHARYMSTHLSFLQLLACARVLLL